MFERMLYKMRLALLTWLIMGFLSPVTAQENCKVLLSSISGTYEGRCKKGFAHGNGVAKGKDTYEGSFKKGLPDGRGTYTWSTGERYVGEWKEGLRDGIGTYYYWEDGDKLVKSGMWIDNQYVGHAQERPEVKNIMGIERYDFQRQGDGNRVQITTYINGIHNVDLEDLIFHGSSGSMFISGGTMGYEGIVFPFKCILTYYSWNRLKTQRVYTRFEFEITQPGRWQVTLHNN
jgi:hypothetical protein